MRIARTLPTQYSRDRHSDEQARHARRLLQAMRAEQRRRREDWLDREWRRLFGGREWVA